MLKLSRFDAGHDAEFYALCYCDTVFQMRVLEEEVEKLQAALSSRETALRGGEHELAALRNKNEDLKRCLHTKEKIIEAMQVSGQTNILLCLLTRND